MNNPTTNNVRTISLHKRLKQQVTVYLLNGFQVKGELLSFDETGLAIFTTQYNDIPDSRPKDVFIPAHAYSTIV